MQGKQKNNSNDGEDTKTHLGHSSAALSKVTQTLVKMGGKHDDRGGREWAHVHTLHPKQNRENERERGGGGGREGERERERERERGRESLRLIWILWRKGGGGGGGKQQNSKNKSHSLFQGRGGRGEEGEGEFMPLNTFPIPQASVRV